MNKMISLVATLVCVSVSTMALSQRHINADSIRVAFAIPELSYAVVQVDSIPVMHALGYHSVFSKDTASLNDRFHIGSNTKAMTAYLIAKYVEMGKLTWQTHFFDLYPEWKLSSNPAFYNITLLDLLSHRSFVQPFQGFEDPEIPAFTGSKQLRRSLFGKFVLTLPVAKKDSLSDFVYSNAGYTLAALMLEKATGKSWEELVIRVFNDEMHLNVQFSWPDNQTKKDTWGHYFENGQLIPVPSNTDFLIDYTEPSGDINLPFKDYVKFIQLHLQGLNGMNNYLDASTYELLLQGISGYSLGWFNIDENGRSWSTHSGTVGTYYTVTHIDRTRKVAYIIFTNSFTEDTQKGVRTLMRKLKEYYGN